MEPLLTIFWDKPTGTVCFIDQTLLPGSFRIERTREVGRLITAIRRLEVRGAPALGIAGGYGVVLAAMAASCEPPGMFMESVRKQADTVRNARPTAVNLSWGVDRVLRKLEDSSSPEEAVTLALAEAEAIAREDAATCRALSKHGAGLLPDSCTVLTHCNAGALACREWGTALGVIRSAVQDGKHVKVIACETRPLLQGARLTAWELARDGIDVTVITDSTASFLMRTGRIDCVIVGADRITRDAVFNKVGTYMHAVSARYHGVPFYVAAPRSSFDPIRNEADVLIEERHRDEIACFGDRVTLPEGVPVINLGFDATPLSMVTALITEEGIVRPENILSFLSSEG
ncbi:MAG: S-methyl-5-thioribose-1-phosphate isomerase [Methanoregulaceae archaeon]|nr:S-methyl-5-thioribose-1-phosphate isomerase [Methanoregulaceae archaeon]